jgi:hypothetical protein
MKVMRRLCRDQYSEVKKRERKAAAAAQAATAAASMAKKRRAVFFVRVFIALLISLNLPHADHAC